MSWNKLSGISDKNIYTPHLIKLTHGQSFDLHGMFYQLIFYWLNSSHYGNLFSNSPVHNTQFYMLDGEEQNVWSDLWGNYIHCQMVLYHDPALKQILINTDIKSKSQCCLELTAVTFEKVACRSITHRRYDLYVLLAKYQPDKVSEIGYGVARVCLSVVQDHFCSRFKPQLSSFKNLCTFLRILYSCLRDIWTIYKMWYTIGDFIISMILNKWAAELNTLFLICVSFESYLL